MFRNLFEPKKNKSIDYSSKTTINLFNGDLLVSSMLIILSVFMLVALNIPIKFEFYLLTCVVFYALCAWLGNNGHYESAYLLYHISSYLIITALIKIYGIDINFQLYYISIGFSIYLYAIKPQKYHNYLLVFYVFSFILASLIPFNSLTPLDEDLKKFFRLNNLIVVCVSVTIKAIKYTNLKENAVEKTVETEKLLKDKEAIFDFFFNSPITGTELKIIEKKTNKVLSYQVNRSLLQLFKVDYEEAQKKTRLDFSPEYQSSGKKTVDYQNEIKELLEEKGQIIYQWDFKDGTNQTIHTEITEVNLQTVDTITNLVLFKDITKQKNTEKELLESELMYRTLFENVYDGIKIDIYNKSDGKKLDCFINKKMLSLFKIKDYDTVVDDYLKYVPEHQSSGQSSYQFILQLRKDFEKDRFINFKMDLINGENQLFTGDFTAIEIEMGNKLKRILIAKDITELAKKEQIIQEQISSLELKHIELKKYIESNKQLELFALKASHDLKNPIVTIEKFAQLLKSINSEKLNKQSIEYLNFIEISAKNLKLLINDFLEFSKIENQKFNIKSINPKKIIQFVLDNLNYQIEKNNAVIKIGNLPNVIKVDEIKFFTLFQNLVTNAIKYRKPDIPTVIEISSEEHDDCFQFNITDNGLGIRDENKTKIFEIYKTFSEGIIDNGNLKGQKSTGIGLSICLKVVELHKGKLWVNSVYGEGSTFSFTISKNLNNSLTQYTDGS